MNTRHTTKVQTTPSSRTSPKARGRGKERGKADVLDGAQVLPSPRWHLGKQRMGLSEALDNKNMVTPDCPYLGPRSQLSKWKQLGADPILLAGIRQGVNAPMHSAPGPKQPRAFMQEDQLMLAIGECLANGVIKKLFKEE